VEEQVEKIKEIMEDSEMISNAISKPLGTIQNDAEIEEELESLQVEMKNEKVKETETKSEEDELITLEQELNVTQPVVEEKDPKNKKRKIQDVEPQEEIPHKKQKIAEKHLLEEK
jgi:hypothetical protein